MADASNNNIVISKKNSGFPDYLNFERLRTEGIDYLGRLSGKIWTDHNVHDPGITMLEVLCYALLDLGYRTNLPEADIFARKPGDLSGDNNFFTAAQILACNPLTITDFRKLLVDIEGVKNAWLEVATEQRDSCRPELPNDPNIPGVVVGGQQTAPRCISYLNGLYHVYIDLEKDVTQIKDAQERKNYEDGIRDAVKNALMAHRNLCEDFIDIRFLCKHETGVCADIELDGAADPEKVYLDVVEKLRSFFSPSPRFYTLQELLDKGKSIDDIFAGRPYNITQSHGFVDTAEFEQLKLRKEIHLSDVYSQLFAVPGVRSVTRLRLRNCDQNNGKDQGWKYHLPENHVPEFSIDCSGFQFTKNGKPVFADVKKFEGLLAINFTRNGKVLYQASSPYLNAQIPNGVYREDLGDYYSVQNDLPQVYGIAAGGLPDSASPARKAQAYQLKAYLLFFDQLLANYLAQLQHMRSLFAMSAAPDAGENHTYFSSQLNSVPDLQKLLRFNATEANNNPLGTEGSPLVLPVNREKFMELIAGDKLKTLDLDALPAYSFASMTAQEIAISQIKDDLFFEQYECQIITKNDECIFYYIVTSSDEIVLVSRKYFKTTREAGEHAVSVKYIGTFDENYRSFATGSDGFSFNIELNLLSFSKYLQLIAENQELFYTRRQGFLDHLLSRFAEQFADYALLSFGFLNDQQSAAAEIKNKERFLTNYDDLSSNRGRAYDYLENNWNNNNVSGFEKKFKALSGIQNWKRHSLCNFVVEQYDDAFVVGLNIAGRRYFSSDEHFATEATAMAAAQALFTALPDTGNYSSSPVEHDNAWQLLINYDNNRQAVYPARFATKEEADQAIGNLTALFKDKPAAESVFIATYKYITRITNSAGETVRTATVAFPSKDGAIAGALKAMTKINDRKKWDFDEKTPALGNLYGNAGGKVASQFIDTGAFKFDVNNSIIGKPDKFTFGLLDNANNFKLLSQQEFNSSDAAATRANELLLLLANEGNYQAFADKGSGRWLLRVINDGKNLAVFSNESNTEQEAGELVKKIAGIIQTQQYTMVIDELPDTWKFKYQLGVEKDNQQLFYSKEAYEKPDAAAVAAAAFHSAIDAVVARETTAGLELVPPKEAGTTAVEWQSPPKKKYSPEIKQTVDNWLAEQKEIKSLSGNLQPEAFRKSVSTDAASQQGAFVYRLVDKDTVPAAYSKPYFTEDSAAADINEVISITQKSGGYLQVCMGGDIIVKRKHPVTGAIWYRYQLVSNNQFYASGAPLVIFESTARYSSPAEAEQAFAENYCSLIHIGSSPAGYLKKISTEEIPVDAAESTLAKGSIAFIPKATMEEKGGNVAVVVQSITELLQTYPVRMTVYQGEEFYGLFSCETRADASADDDCDSAPVEKWVYYFRLLTGGKLTEKWQSLAYYQTAAAAIEAFNFFRILLYYRGNYYADCDNCQQRVNQYTIYIREVLAESTRRFSLEEDAWGPEGVQKFICVSQADDAFHTYSTKENCCHSFYVACGNGLVYHPCKYDRSKQRDEALLKLYRLSAAYQKNKSWQATDNGDTLNLLDENGQAFARMASGLQSQTCSTERIALLADTAANDGQYAEEDGRIVFKDGSAKAIAWSVQEGITLEGWKQTLQAFICYYPVLKSKDEKTGNQGYCIEIKIPGFNTCKDDAVAEGPCGCGEKPADTPGDCYIAWKSTCCYATCAEAEAALLTIMRLLLNYEYYQPVFDCSCGAYGITMQVSRQTAIDDPILSFYFEEANTRNWQNSEIIAVNPQCYPGAEPACNAIVRAKKMINSEGLHLVEHILLRPHCLPQDCQCAQYSEPCNNSTGCRFDWMVPDEDPCIDENNICFTPGADRYSFIATVALPAWPTRFRKPENRKLLENILYREAPAHVLLRIVWLAPHDMCCFETKFKNWSRWLAQKTTCIDNFNTCDFLEFLFNRNYECPGECDICSPCGNDMEQAISCFGNACTLKPETSFLEQVNELYCLQVQQCEKYRFTGCETRIQLPDFFEDEAPEGTALVPATETAAIPDESGSRSATAPAQRKTRSVKSKSAPAPEDAAAGSLPRIPAVDSKSKAQLVNSRLKKYRTAAEQVIEKTGNHPLAAKTGIFLSDPAPAADRLLKLVTEIVENKVSRVKNSKALSKKQVADLAANATCYYLDKVCFNGKDMEKLQLVKPVFEKLRTVKMNVESLLAYWNLPELLHYEPSLDGPGIKKLFEGRKTK